MKLNSSSGSTIQAAENEGLVNVISAPRVTTLNNESASIQSGLQIPVQTVSNRTVSVTFVNATLQLEVTPHVTAEGTIMMDINVSKKEPQLAFAIVGATNAPIATKEAQTKVVVRDGATAVIYAELGFAPPLARGLFCLSRSVGALAHGWEQMGQGGRNKGPTPPVHRWTYDGENPIDPAPAAAADGPETAPPRGGE